MKITIDTKEDTQDEIQNVIKMLSSLVGNEVMSNQGSQINNVPTQENQNNNVVAQNPDIFSNAGSKEPEGQTQNADMFKMFNNESEKKDEPKTELEEDFDLGIPRADRY